MLSKNHPIILFLDRNGFSVFQDTQPNIPRFNFTQDIVANLDVINKEQFSSLIATFIQINKILPSSFAVILSDTITYVKNFNPQPNPEQEQKDEVQSFLENVPFEEVLAKVIKTEQKNTLVAVNKDLVMTIADVFVNKGSTIEAIIPSFMYGSNVSFAEGLTQDNMQAILGESEISRTGNLLTDQQRITSPQSLEIKQKDSSADGEKKPQNLIQYILVGVFVTLLIVLAVVYLNLGASKTLPVKKAKNSASTINVPTAIPTLVQATIMTAPVDLKSIKIKIVQSSQSDEKAVNLKSELLKIGFADIASEISEVSIPEKSSVVFSQSIPADLRNNIIAQVKKILPDISVLESQDVNFTITILIGKS